MTGIVILPAGREDAFEDYKQFIRDGHPIEDIESYLNDEDLELFRTTSDDDLVHVWGDLSRWTWCNVERTISRSSTTMTRSSRGGKSSNSDTTPTLRSISGEKTLNTVAGTTKARGST